MTRLLPLLALFFCNCEFVSITDSAGNRVSRKFVEGPRPSYYGDINRENFAKWLPLVGKGDYRELSMPPPPQVWTTYTGRLKTYSTLDGELLAVVREIRTGGPKSITTWQGGNPNAGYYGRRRMIERIYQ